MFEAEDWDMSTRVLSGLQPPAKGMTMYDRRYDGRYPDSQAQLLMKSVAVSLYNHQKMTEMFKPNVSNGKNNLAFMICASYEPSPPGTPEKGDRPKLRHSTMLPLGHWDRLYYVVVAEIRKMYAALQQEFGMQFEDGATILHDAGTEGASGPQRLPISAIGLASVLEDAWALVTNSRLTAALDLAVRIRNAQDADIDNEDERDDESNASDNEDAGGFWSSNKRSFKHEHNENCHCVAVAEGLADVHAMTPDAIIDMVWEKQAEESRRKSGRSSADQTLLARCRAEVREASPHNRAPSTQRKVNHTMTAHCECDVSCHCREVCDLQANECGCAFMRGQVRDMVAGQEKQHALVHNTFDTPEHALPNNVLGAVSNDVAQMQIAALAQPTPYMVQAFYATSEAADENDREILRAHRERSNTNESQLAYVPAPRTPSRAHKDAYPLGFYCDISGHRYPPFRSNVRDQAPPVHGTSFYSPGVPARKPVPTSSAQDSDAEMSPDEQASSPTDLSQITYPPIPKSESQGLFTQSFPVAAIGNPRDPDPAAAYADLAQETQNAIRPFSDTPVLSTPNLLPAPTRPDIHTANTSPDVIHLPKRTATSAKSKTKKADLLNKPQPPLPEPDFIAPRPAAKQRYVSAGGNAKLSDRQEIDGPAFVLPQTNSSGAAIPKEELFQKLNDPDFVKATFGADAVGKMNTSVSFDSQRPSYDAGSKRTSGQDSSPGKKSIDGRKSTRDSRENLIKSEKRERTESGGSASGMARFGKLKRVFSRKNSECE